MATIYSIGPSASMEEASGSYISPPPKPQKTSSSETGSTTLDVANLNQRTVYEIGTQPTFPFIAVTKYTASIAMGCNTTDIKTTDSGEDTGESIVDDTDDTSGGDDTGESLVDEDGDGYASIESGGDDCDDTDASVNPGATEVTENGVDDDCDSATADEAAVDDPTRLFGAYTTSSSITGLGITGARTADELTNSIATINKTDSSGVPDDYADIVLGARLASGGGAVYVVYGPGSSGTISSVADITITGDTSTDQLGYGTVVPNSQDTDSAYLLMGSGATSSTDGYLAIAEVRGLEDGTVSDVATTIIAGSRSAGYATGWYSTWLDLSSSSDEKESVLTQFGNLSTKVYGAMVFTDALSATSYADADLFIFGTATSDGTGNAVGAGDLNGDGVDEALVGSPMSTVSGLSKAGRVNIQDGTSTGGSIYITDVDTSILSVVGSAQLGSFIKTADIDGDGYDDVIAGAPYENHDTLYGCLYLFVSDGTLSSSLDTSDAYGYVCGVDYSGSSYDIRDVGAAADLADIDLDGNIDIAYSSNSIKGGSSYTDGNVYVKYGPLSALSGSHQITDSTSPYDASIAGSSGDYLGRRISLTGSMNGTGYPDLLVGASAYSSGTGKAWVFDGMEY